MLKVAFVHLSSEGGSMHGGGLNSGRRVFVQEAASLDNEACGLTSLAGGLSKQSLLFPFAAKRHNSVTSARAAEST